MQEVIQNIFIQIAWRFMLCWRINLRDAILLSHEGWSSVAFQETIKEHLFLVFR